MNIDTLSSILQTQAKLSHHIAHENTSTQTPAQPSSFMFIIFEVAQSHYTDSSQSQQLAQISDQAPHMLYHIQLSPQHIIQHNIVTPAPADIISFISTTPMLPGELLFATGYHNKQQLVINPNTLSHIDIHLQQALKQNQFNQSDTPNTRSLNQAASELLTTLLPVIQQLSQNNENDPELKTLAAITSLKAHHTPPLEWLAQHSFHASQTKSVPAWVQQLPHMVLKNMHQQNLRLIEHFLDNLPSVTAHSKDKLTSSTLSHNASPSHKTNNNTSHNIKHNVIQNASPSNQQEKKDDQFQNMKNNLSTWLQTQKRWLSMPQSFLIQPGSHLALLQLHNGSALTAIHHQLLHLWPEYKQAEHLILSLKNRQQAHLMAYTPDLINQHKKKTTAELLIELFQTTKNEHQSALLKALTLRAGMAELMLSQHSGPDYNLQHENQQNLQFSLPYATTPEHTSWLQTSLYNDASQNNAAEQCVQWIDLDFISTVFGHIRFRLTFPQGFNTLFCQPSIWIDNQTTLKQFQKYEHQLKDNLTRAGLTLESLQWIQKQPEKATVSYQSQHQIDDYA